MNQEQKHSEPTPSSREYDNLVIPFECAECGKEQLLNAATTSTTSAANTDLLKLDSRTEVMQTLMDQIDWYGNTTLHHAFANDAVNLPSISVVLSRYPQYASARNQFGRVPLHYAVDRSKCNINGVKLLLKYYPQGVGAEDQEGITPYDLAVKWKHPAALRRALLNVDPSIDPVGYNKVTYGSLLSLFMCNFSGAGAAASAKCIGSGGGDSKRVGDDSTLVKQGRGTDEVEMLVQPFVSSSERLIESQEQKQLPQQPHKQPQPQQQRAVVVDTSGTDGDVVGFEGEEEKLDEYDRSDETNYSHTHSTHANSSTLGNVVKEVEQLDDIEDANFV